MGRPDTLWSVNTLARKVTKWDKGCDKRLHRLIEYLNSTADWGQLCFVGDHPKDCFLALFCDASFAGDLEDSKSTNGAYLCIVGDRTFVPVSWLCKRQTAVSHSSSEAEVISLDAALRMEGIPAILLWELILDVLNPQESIDTAERRVNTPKQSIWSIDDVPPSFPVSSGRGKLLVFEDNEAVIKMTIKGRSPAMRHVARTHRVDLDWLWERIRVDPGIFIKYVGTKEQIADVFTKGQFSAEQWHHLCRLAQIGPVRSFSLCSSSSLPAGPKHNNNSCAPSGVANLDTCKTNPNTESRRVSESGSSKRVGDSGGYLPFISHLFRMNCPHRAVPRQPFRPRRRMPNPL